MLPIDILRKLYSDQAYYAEKFVPTSEFLDEKRFYKKVSNFVHGGDIIIDIGCGCCKLIHYIKIINRYKL